MAYPGQFKRVDEEAMETVRIAAAQYRVDRMTSLEAWEKKIHQWVENAALRGAQLLVFPEYAAMELAGIDADKALDLHASLDLVISYGDLIDDVHRQLAMQFGITILGGSRPCRNKRGVVVNRARIYCPDGSSAFQDKIVMTRFEREIWGVSGGSDINVMDTPIGRIGVAICYDAEFPLIARTQAAAGAQIILVPSATDTMKGYWRVRIGSQARALENQCYVVQAPTVGSAPWLPAMDENFGFAGIYGPPDEVAPDDGVFAIGEVDTPEWVIADISLAEVARWRTDGAVLPFRDWPEQFVKRQEREVSSLITVDAPLTHEFHEKPCGEAIPNLERIAL